MSEHSLNTEENINEIAEEEIVNELVNIYNIPEAVVKQYLKEDAGVLITNTVNAMWSAQEDELAQWVQSNDIRNHAGESNENP